ncbi:ATP-binding protein [Leptolyngbya sp. 'hensonii']|uniref:sensor histidine kinase n=1 Tax=Leptolyngbya sp. 'hensonii' TaxID=1922337 RepID=UPI00209B62D1|nr:ATP-binding protein [Leptolyngbya sp. 'hensonii']
MLGHSSFRRVLLARILLLSVPVLLIGEVVAYRKARSVLLETVRQNLTESAIRKAEDIQQTITSLQAHLLTLSGTYPLYTGPTAEPVLFLNQIQQQLPPQAQCSELTDLQSGRVVTTTCSQGQFPLFPNRRASETEQGLELNAWPQQQTQMPLDRSVVYISPTTLPNQSTQMGRKGQLRIVLSAPVYDRQGKLRYALSIQVALNRPQQIGVDRPGSLTGYTVVLDKQGTILAYPDGRQVGRNISQEQETARFQNILENALNRKKSSFELLEGSDQDPTWLIGYTTIKVPMTTDRNHTWAVLAVTRWDNALARLEGIKQILVILTIVLLMTLFLTTLYMARELSRPLEKLGQYALQIQRRHTDTSTIEGSSSPYPSPLDLEDPISTHGSALATQSPLNLLPKDFKIRELSQLAEALDSMVNRLEDRATELETAWQAAQAANQLKSEFLANTSHELRTPLNAIIGCIRLVRDGCCDGPEEEQEFLQRADEAAVHLLNIINDLLDIAKIEAGTLSVTLEPINLHQVLKEVIDLQVVPIQEKGLNLKLADLESPLIVLADVAKLKQVLLNIVCNAVKFTEQGSITISTHSDLMSLHRLGSEQPVVIVSVQDTGIGVDPGQQSKLFRPFVMVDGSTTRKFEGTGLGLAISRNLMRLMGGDVQLYSAGVGQGTTVDAILPLPVEMVTREITQPPATAYADVTSS